MRPVTVGLAGGLLAIGLVAGGYAAGVATAPGPPPAPAGEIAVLDVPPACPEIGPAVQTERATAATLAAAQEHSVEQSEAYGTAVLSTDPPAIKKEAKALDEALRDEQQLALDLATDRAATDTFVTDCTKEAQ